LGAVALGVVLVGLIAPPFYAFILLMDGNYVFAPAVLIAWLCWSRVGWRLLRWMLQGLEYPNF